MTRLSMRLLRSLVSSFPIALCAICEAQCVKLGWTEVGGGVNGIIHTMIEFDDGSGKSIVVAGEFTEAGGAPVSTNIAKWNGKSWASLGTGADGPIYVLAIHDDGTGAALFAGGSFTSIGGIAANRIAKWNGENWSALDLGVTGTVRALASHSDKDGPVLYVGGEFTGASGVFVSRIAEWRNGNWAALANGLNDTVMCLTMFDDGTGTALFAGGNFTIAGHSAKRIARWDGSTWSAVGSELNTFYAANSFSVVKNPEGSRLYASGSFVLGGIDSRIAEWTGSYWDLVGLPVGGGEPQLCSRQPMNESRLFMSNEYGDPTIWFGGVGVWNGTQWRSVGSLCFTGLRPKILLVSDLGGSPALYAGGSISSIGSPMTFASFPLEVTFDNCNANQHDDACEVVKHHALDCNLNAMPDPCEVEPAYVMKMSASSSLWGPSSARDLLWMSQYSVVEGKEIITHIAMPSSYGVPDRWLVHVAVYSDPNQDGHPGDAELLASSSAQHVYNGWGWYDEGLFVVAMEPTWVGTAGTSFFIAATTHLQQEMRFPAAPINSVGHDRSWTMFGPEGIPYGIDLINIQNLPTATASPHWALRALSIDCNANAVWDSCDIADSTSADRNMNGIPDECEPKMCLGDIAPPDGDGTIGVPDLLAIINSWGPCMPPNCFADIAPPQGDGNVGVLDLLAVINEWGPCP